MNDFFEDNTKFVDVIKKKSKKEQIDEIVKSKGLYSELINRIGLGISKSMIYKWLVSNGIDYDKQAVYSYIDNIIKKIGITNIGSYSKLKPDLLRKIDNNVSELEELQKLYELQKTRINIDFETEKKIKKLFKTTGYEVYLASKILSDIIRIKMELGIIDRQKLSEFDGANINVINIGDKQVFISDDTKRKVLSIINDIKKLNAGNYDNKDKIISNISDKIDKTGGSDE